MDSNLYLFPSQITSSLRRPKRRGRKFESSRSPPRTRFESSRSPERTNFIVSHYLQVKELIDENHKTVSELKKGFIHIILSYEFPNCISDIIHSYL